MAAAEVSNNLCIYWAFWIPYLGGESMVPSGGGFVPRRLVSSAFVFVFCALRSSLIGSPSNPAFPHPELAVARRCLAYTIALAPSVRFQVFGLVTISPPFNYPLTHLHLYHFVSICFYFFTLYVSSSLSPSPSWKSEVKCKSSSASLHSQRLLCWWLFSLKSSQCFSSRKYT